MLKFLMTLWCNIIIFSWGSVDAVDRLKALGKVMLVVGPVTFIAESLGLWYVENRAFTIFAAGFVLANAVTGGIVKKIQGRFDWEVLFIKTIKMILIISGVYVVLEGIVSPIGDNVVTDGFIASFQVATLLYPGSKILKNAFIWSDGEHPPKWIMQKIYNFQENGDLKEFLSEKKPEGFQEEDEDSNINDYTD